MAVRLRRRHQHHQHADQIERGCARIEKRLNALGAKVTRVPARERSFSA
jgi:UDP-N-acetylglucosamine enolpyruvyl transferase